MREEELDEILTPFLWLPASTATRDDGVIEMEKGIERISKMLEIAHTDETVFPPTILYKEGWMLRIILHIQSEGVDCLPFSFLPEARWYSEALIGSPFLRRFKKDSLYENYTHLDASVGHFDIRPGTKTGLMLRSDSTQFVAIEAKMLSTLSKGTKNAPYYDQAARIVACVAWEISRLNRVVNDFESLGFYVLAPHEQITKGKFSAQTNKSSIREKVKRRIDAYSEDEEKYADLRSWYNGFFLPVLERIDIRCVSWETIIDKIDEVAIRNFYSRCLKFNISSRS